MKRVLVTGAGGFVGSRAAQQLSERFEIITVPKGFLSAAGEAEISDFVKSQHPDVLIHTAAVSDIGYSEAHPEESNRANIMLPVWLAKASRDIGAKLLAFSSDQVYAGLEGNGVWEENMTRTPSNLYGRQKLESEKRVLDILPEAVMLRATWMYDMPAYRLPIRSNMLLNMYRAALNGEEMFFSEADYRGITYVRQVVELLVPAFDIPGGVYNFGSENTVNMYETAVAFRDALGLNVKITKSASGKDSRETSLAMNCGKLRRCGIVFDDTCDGIKRCAADYGL